MNRNFGYLSTLIVEKNQLNRERRRFWNILNMMRKGKPFSGITRREAEKGYKRSRAEMIQLTSHMRKVCKELRVSLVWTASWSIAGFSTGKGFVMEREIEQLALDYEVDEILLG